MLYKHYSPTSLPSNIYDLSSTLLLSPLTSPLYTSLPLLHPSFPPSLHSPSILPLVLFPLSPGVLQSVLEAAVEGCNVLTLCELGDSLILEETGKVYKREKEMKKGKNNFRPVYR